MLELTNVQTIKSILKENRLWAQKRLGQNFLVAKQPLMILIESAQISADDVIIEVGPGLGTLTQELAQKAKLVLAIEKDYKLVDYLRKYFKNCSNVKIIHQDILTYDLELIKYHYKVVANLPYNITSPVIRKFLEADNSPRSMFLTVQKEVAERICAEPGDSNRGVLTVMVEFHSQAEIIGIVKRDNFFPIPKVDSAIIKLRVTNDGYKKLLKVTESSKKLKVTSANRERSEHRNLVATFFRIVKAGFSQKRRQIHNSLEATLQLPNREILAILEEARIAPTLRAEDLSLSDWINLYEKVQKTSRLNSRQEI